MKKRKRDIVSATVKAAEPFMPQRNIRKARQPSIERVNTVRKNAKKKRAKRCRGTTASNRKTYQIQP